MLIWGTALIRGSGAYLKLILKKEKHSFWDSVICNLWKFVCLQIMRTRPFSITLKNYALSNLENDCDSVDTKCQIIWSILTTRAREFRICLGIQLGRCSYFGFSGFCAKSKALLIKMVRLIKTLKLKKIENDFDRYGISTELNTIVNRAWVT